MAAMTPLDILEAAREKIRDPAKWGKGHSWGRPPNVRCAGEVIEDSSKLDFDARQKAYEVLECAAGGRLVDWNDAPERTHAEVLAAFNLAIAFERDMPRSRRSAA